MPDKPNSKLLLLPFILIGAIFLLAAAPGFCASPDTLVCRHDLKVELQPQDHMILVRDDIGIEGWKGKELIFSLSSKGRIESVKVNGKPVKYSFRSGRLILSASRDDGRPIVVSISFDAVFNDPVAEDQAGSDNPGLGVEGSIGETGTFLLADSGWYPGFGGPGQDFKLTVTAPRGIYAVTAGELIGHEDRDRKSITRWKTGPIGQGLSLSAGKYIIRSKVNGRIPIYTFFTSETDSLSRTYLDASASHIEFYERLFGPYPFPKFAVVENFFPTGYGFPSYTLLGKSVLKLPFIPETSLRHEIAHCWWGNGVLVDYASGNWCEGLTTYVADYLSREIVSAADAKLYRQQILRDYATFASSGADFPLKDFESRVSPATRVVGYGKAAFVFHMIRGKLGDEAFWNGLRQIFRERLFVKASWDDFRDVFVRTGGWDAKDAGVFFEQWVARSGAPVLKLKDARIEGEGTGRRVAGLLVQDKPWYRLDITAGLEVSGNERLDTKIRIEDGSAPFAVSASAAPKKLIVDPDVNTFRLLYPEEIPATVNSVKGSRKPAAVLSDGAPPEVTKAFYLLLAGLDQEGAPIIAEKEAEKIMNEDRDFIFFGLPRSEKLKFFFETAPKTVSLSPRSFSVEGSSGADCLFLAFADPVRKGKITALFLPVPGTADDSILTAARKITHYGKYSFLTFSGGVIREKGIWEVTRSPLVFDF